MYSSDYRHQCAEQVVHTADWSASSLVYEEGKREKSTVFSPSEPPYEFLRSDFQYLSKKSNPRAPEQFWMEIVAYRLGAMLDVAVPPSFVSVDSEGVCRALIEWFYDEDDPRVSYNNAYSLLVSIDKHLDKERGDRHTLTLATRMLNILTKQHGAIFNPSEHEGLSLTYSSDGLFEDFFKMVLFDAIIGNTDRHHENWGIVSQSTERNLEIRLSPAFDNGTSLGYDYREGKMARLLTNPSWFEIYASRGTHHLRPKIGEPKFSHTALIEQLVSRSPALSDIFETMICFDIEKVKDMLFSLTEFDVPTTFSPLRAEFTANIIEAKRNALNKAMLP